MVQIEIEYAKDRTSAKRRAEATCTSDLNQRELHCLRPIALNQILSVSGKFSLLLNVVDNTLKSLEGISR